LFSVFGNNIFERFGIAILLTFKSPSARHRRQLRGGYYGGGRASGYSSNHIFQLSLAMERRLVEADAVRDEQSAEILHAIQPFAPRTFFNAVRRQYGAGR